MKKRKEKEEKKDRATVGRQGCRDATYVEGFFEKKEKNLKKEKRKEKEKEKEKRKEKEKENLNLREKKGKTQYAAVKHANLFLSFSSFFFFPSSPLFPLFFSPFLLLPPIQ